MYIYVFDLYIFIRKMVESNFGANVVYIIQYLHKYNRKSRRGMEQ